MSQLYFAGANTVFHQQAGHTTTGSGITHCAGRLRLIGKSMMKWSIITTTWTYSGSLELYYSLTPVGHLRHPTTAVTLCPGTFAAFFGIYPSFRHPRIV
jgi:hypothetical protein